MKFPYKMSRKYNNILNMQQIILKKIITNSKFFKLCIDYWQKLIIFA